MIAYLYYIIIAIIAVIVLYISIDTVYHAQHTILAIIECIPLYNKIVNIVNPCKLLENLYFYIICWTF